MDKKADFIISKNIQLSELEQCCEYQAVVIYRVATCSFVLGVELIAVPSVAVHVLYTQFPVGNVVSKLCSGGSELVECSSCTQYFTV